MAGDKRDRAAERERREARRHEGERASKRIARGREDAQAAPDAALAGAQPSIHNRYSGDMDDNGLRHGRGLFRTVNGDQYEGEWLHGKQHGDGSFFSNKTGERITGQFWEGRSLSRR